MSDMFIVKKIKMIFTYFLTCIFIIQMSFADKDTLPVFLVDYERVMNDIYVDPNPFTKVSSVSFSNILLNAIKNSEGIIIFVEDSFCMEDISTKDMLGSPYNYLHRSLLEDKVNFLPAVEDPYKTLKQMFQPQNYNVFYLNIGMKIELLNNSKYIYVFFIDSLNETRSELLRKHDLIIKEVYFAFRKLKPGPVLAFYTGKVNPVVVEKLSFVPIKPDPIPKDMGVMIASTGALFRFSGVYAITAKRRSVFNQLPTVADETWTRRKLSTKMAYTDFEMQFNFSFGDDDWILDNVALLEGGEEVGRTEMKVGAPWNFSYACGEPLVLVNTRDGSSITISQYQIQPYARRYDEVDNLPLERRQFARSVSCSPYFTCSILACLFVTFILLGIMLYGATFLYSCNSNNRYDDAQGKPLVVTES